ncbi:hypothetical protein ZIOFF_066152 [Zingiber officinale]|uniref:glucose-6-phosphate dehydrogenase (NADP(+)) n=1 Tax=Zingiber officinale TaxID=94328 RepID=A0A8J5EY09_ZINOF|nr:hypothetical protein ZIOFF_066152 [Zingiber officinale]
MQELCHVRSGILSEKDNMVTMHNVKMDRADWNPIISFYVKCGCLDFARQVFDEMSDIDITLITGYMSYGLVALSIESCQKVDYPVLRFLQENDVHIFGYVRTKLLDDDLRARVRVYQHKGVSAEREDVLSRYFLKKLYRIDHYLGKELVQNLLVLHFANWLCLPLWNRDNIANIQIASREDFGTEELCLVAMEQPISLKHEHVRDEKVKVLQSVLPIKHEKVIFGQYEGYKDDLTVAGSINTPTIATVVWRIQND